MHNLLGRRWKNDRPEKQTETDGHIHVFTVLFFGERAEDVVSMLTWTLEFVSRWHSTVWSLGGSVGNFTRVSRQTCYGNFACDTRGQDFESRAETSFQTLCRVCAQELGASIDMALCALPTEFNKSSLPSDRFRASALLSDVFVNQNGRRVQELIVHATPAQHSAKGSLKAGKCCCFKVEDAVV